MPFKPVGVDENNKFPAAVLSVLQGIFVPLDSSNNLPNTVIDNLKSSLAWVDSNNLFGLPILNALRTVFQNKVLRNSPKGSTGQTFYGIPNVTFGASGTYSSNATGTRYVPFSARNVTTISSFLYEVVTASSACTFNFGIYAVDLNGQPTGAPLYDSGAISIPSGGTGVKTVTPASPVVLQPGNYLLVTATTSVITLRVCYGGGDSFLPTLLSSAGSNFQYNVNTPSPLPTNPPPWTATSRNSNGLTHVVLFSWTES